MVEHREDAADGEAEEGEDEDREVALEHWGGLTGAQVLALVDAVAAVIHRHCDNLLHSAFPHQQAESRPF